MANKPKKNTEKRLARLERRAHKAVREAQAALAEFVAEIENRVMIAEVMGQDTDSPEVNLLTEAAIAIHPSSVDSTPASPASSPRKTAAQPAARKSTAKPAARKPAARKPATRPAPKTPPAG